MRLAALGLLAGVSACAHGGPSYARFADVPYGYGGARRVWSPRAQLGVHVEELGARPAPALVLLHPWGLNMTVWADVAPELAERHRVLLVDLPGHGKSDKPSGPYTMRRLAAAVLDVLDASGVERAVLMGNSLGGATALAVAELAPARVSGLVLLAAPGGDILPEPVRRAARGLANPQALETLSDEGWFVGLVLAEASLSPTAARVRDDVIALRRTAEWSAWSRATIRILRAVAEYRPELERLEMPALVVAGTRDPLITSDLNARLAERLPRGQLEVLEGCGHLMEIECPAALMDRLRPFLAARSGSASPDLKEKGPAGH